MQIVANLGFFRGTHCKFVANSKELQHAIQDEEGFEDGSNLQLATREFVEDRQKKAKKEAERLVEELKKSGLTEKANK